MKALTLKQPWAWAVAQAGKWIENRRWEPPEAMLGETFAIHAGLKKPTSDLLEAVRECALEARSKVKVPDAFELGGIVAVARLEGFVVEPDADDIAYCATAEGEKRGAIALARRAVGSPWFIGPIGFCLADVRRLPTPIPCKGALRFWELPEDVARKVRRAVEKGR